MGAGLRPLPLTAQAVHLCVDMCEGVKIEMKEKPQHHYSCRDCGLAVYAAG